MDFLTPPPLAPGDKVAVVAPSSGGAREAPHVFELGLKRLRDVFDLEPIIYPTARQGDEFLAANPRARAADIHAAARAPEIRGIVATIGGDDQLRVLRHLDAELFREHPTRFYGASDNTNLGLALWNAGVVSYNGAQLMTTFAVPGELPAYTERYCRRAVFEDSLGELEPAPKYSDEPSTWWSNPEELATPPAYEPNPGREWTGGSEAVSGPLWGGTQSILGWQLAADRYLPATDTLDGAILCLETSELIPSASAVGGTLMSLGERGLLERFDGVLVGRAPTRSFRTEPPEQERETYRRRLRERIADEVRRYNPDAPVVFGVEWGHTIATAPLPLGEVVELDPASETVRLGEE